MNAPNKRSLYIMSNRDYHSRSEISHSQLKLMDVPANFKHQVVDGHTSDTTDAQQFGTDVHAALLEPTIFKHGYVVEPKVDKRTKDGKAAYAAFLAQAKNRQIISESNHAKVIEIRDAVLAHPMVSRLGLFSGGSAEMSGFWTDEQTGVKCRCRPDYLHAEAEVAIDLKTGRDASAWGFQKAIYDYGYASQAAFYVDGLAACGVSLRDYLIVAVETKAPYLVAVYRLDDTAIEYGRRRYREWLNKYVECKASGVWPGYADNDIPTISLPEWAFRQEEQAA